MKKRFFLLLVLTAALLMAGTATALATTADSDHAHWAWCDEPNVCAECGEAYSGPDVRHDIQWGTYASDAEYHWHPCSHCDAKIERGKHRARCTNPNVCYYCKAECNIDAENLSHSYSDYKKIDEQYHAQICNDCNQIIEKWEHFVYCDDNSHTCVYCYQPCPKAPVQHESDYTLSSDENYHWYTCKRCNEELDKTEHRFNASNVCIVCNYERKIEPTETPVATPVGPHDHWAWCDTSDVCAVCGEAYSGPDVRHDIQWGTYASDAEYHWTLCSRCDAKIDRAKHWAHCTNPNVCIDCKAECNIDAANLDHSYSGYKKIDEQYHALICNDCNQIIEKWEHSVYCDDETHTCIYCYQPCTEGQVQHERSSSLSSNEKYHWYTCVRCNEELDKEIHWFVNNVCTACGYEREVEAGPHIHWAWCNNTTVCAECGEPYDGSDVRHEFDDYIYAWDENYHWNPCKRCDAKINRIAHWANCTGPDDVCIQCNAKCTIATDRLLHSYGSSSRKIDEHYHAEFCVNCNQMISEKYEHTVYCDDESHTCFGCNQPCLEAPVVHDTWQSSYEWDESNHWYVCKRCQEKTDIEEHVAACDAPGKCMICGAEYSGNNIRHNYLNLIIQQDEKYHWYDCPDCDEKILMGAHIYGAGHVCMICGYEGKTEPTDTPSTAPTDKPTEPPTEGPTAIPSTPPADVPTKAPVSTPTAAATESPTEMPTTAPTGRPTEIPARTPAPTPVPTAAPTAAPSPAPTAAAHKHTWTVTARTAAACEKDGVIAYSCACGETKFETIKALGHSFSAFAPQGDGSHRGACDRCGAFMAEKCKMESRSVNGISCQACGVCGYTSFSALTGMNLPAEPMAGASARTAAGEAAPVQVFDLTPALPEGYTFALCLRIVPQADAAITDGVRIAVPCNLDMANLRLVFLADGKPPVELSFEVMNGQLIFTVTAPGVFALVPIQA